MKRNFDLKPRKEADIPAEKLLDILCGMFPEDIAKRTFDNLQSKKYEEKE